MVVDYGLTCAYLEQWFSEVLLNFLFKHSPLCLLPGRTMSFASLGTSPGDAETTGPGSPLENHSLRQLLGESAKSNPRSFLSFFSRDMLSEAWSRLTASTCKTFVRHPSCISYLVLLWLKDTMTKDSSGRFILAYGSGGTVHNGEEGIASGSQQRSQLQPLQPQKAGRVNWKWGRAVNLHRPPSVTEMHFLQQGSTSSKSK